MPFLGERRRLESLAMLLRCRALLCLVAIAWLLCTAACRDLATAEVETAMPLADPAGRVAPPAAEAVAGTADPMSWVGVLLPRRSVDVAIDSTGEVKAMTALVGERVRRGDSLAQIDTEPVRQELAMARASLTALQAEVSRARVQFAEARARLVRRQALSESFSREDLAAAELEQETAEAAQQAALARVTEQQARVDQLAREVERTAVRAPFDGTVAMRFVEPGDLIRPGLPIVRLISSDDLLLRFAMPPDEATRLSPGRPVVATLETSGREVVAAVRDVAPEVDAGSLMIFVEATVTSESAAESGAQAGMVARVRLGNTSDSI